MEKFHGQNLKGNCNSTSGCIILNDTPFLGQILKTLTLGGIQYIGFSIPEHNVVMLSSSAQVCR
jgi:hypothetical protein